MRVVFLGLILLLTLAAGAQAQVTYHLVTEPWPPYGYEEAGVAKGTDVDVLNAVAKKLGIAFTFEFLPWGRAMEMAKRGTADGIFSLYNLPDRREFLTFPNTPLSEEVLAVYYAKANKPARPLTTLDDLSGLLVGVLQDNSHGTAFDSAKNFRRDESMTLEMALKKLAGGRMDVAVLNEAVAGDYLIRRPELDVLIEKAPLVVNRDSLYVGFSNGPVKAKLLSVERIDQALAELVRDGAVLAIQRKYFKK